MRKRLSGMVLAAMLVVAMAPAAAQAKPLDVDCDQLAQTDVLFFSVAPLSFAHLGELISFFQTNDEVFAEASVGFADVSEFFGPRIEFESMTQTVSTHSKCGLTPLVMSLVGN